MRTYSAQVVPDGAVCGRAVRTSLQRGPYPVVVCCGRCATWLAVGHRPDDTMDVLLACSACGAVNDPLGATPVPDPGTAPSGLPPTEVWARWAVERVHGLTSPERRWPRRTELDAG